MIFGNFTSQTYMLLTDPRSTSCFWCLVKLSNRSLQTIRSGAWRMSVFRSDRIWHIFPTDLLVFYSMSMCYWLKRILKHIIISAAEVYRQSDRILRRHQYQIGFVWSDILCCEHVLIWQYHHYRRTCYAKFPKILNLAETQLSY